MNYNMNESIGFIISRTHAKMRNNLFQRLKNYDVTSEQWVILNKLWEKDGVPQKDLSALSYKDQPNTTRILDKLENKGYIRRELSSKDRRSFLVYLTDEGRILQQKLLPIAAVSLEKAMAGFSEEETEALKEMLRRITRNLS